MFLGPTDNSKKRSKHFFFFLGSRVISDALFQYVLSNKRIILNWSWPCQLLDWGILFRMCKKSNLMRVTDQKVPKLKYEFITYSMPLKNSKKTIIVLAFFNNSNMMTATLKSTIKASDRCLCLSRIRPVSRRRCVHGTCKIWQPIAKKV